MIAIAEKQALPVIWFCEGGGGRPGDVDVGLVSQGGLVCSTFYHFGRLSGLVPLVGLVSGYCFAGNAAILGTCDVIIACKNSNIGMGGPVMIEGGGLGVFKPGDVGPAEEQYANGVVDVLAEDEASAVAIAKQYLSYFQGALAPPPAAAHASGEGSAFPHADQGRLRGVVPSNRLRVYEMRSVIALLCDTDSFLELRGGWAPGMITGFCRVEGKPLGILANNPQHLGGAIDADAALKAARFMELCDAFGIPMLFLCDCPGFMVGPEHERQAAVRKVCKMYAVGGSMSVPFFTIVTRKAYGLGAQAMAGGMMMGPNLFCVAWPTAEFGGMGLEGAVRLGFVKELSEAEKHGPAAYKELYDTLIAASYSRGEATNLAQTFEVDDVIDPAESRQLIVATMEAHPTPAGRRTSKKRPCVSTW